jgi:hypothetical protein
MKITTTYERVQAFIVTAQRWLVKSDDNEFNRLGYAISRVMPRAETLIQEFKQKIADLEIDLCVVGEKDVPVRDSRGMLTFTTSALKELNKRREAMFQNDQIEIEAHIPRTMPKSKLTHQEQFYFQGFVLPLRTDEEIEAAFDQEDAAAAKA